MKNVLRFEVDVDETGVWHYVRLVSGRLPGWGRGDELEQHPHYTSAVRYIVWACHRAGRRHIVLDGREVDIAALAAGDSFLRKYHPELAARAKKPSRLIQDGQRAYDDAQAARSVASILRR